MRARTERDQCQAKLDILIEGFMGDDWGAYREAVAWLRDFTDQKNIDSGRVMWGSHWSTPQKIAMRQRARLQRRLIGQKGKRFIPKPRQTIADQKL